MPELKIQTIRNLHDLEALRPEWMPLFESVDATPFQSPAWLLAWWRHFGNDELRTIAVRDGAEVVGLFPCYIDASNSGSRELKFIGTGISDYLEGLIACGFETAVCERFFDWLANSTGDWDACSLEQLRPQSSIVQFSGANRKLFSDSPGCVCAPLPETLDQWHKKISPNLSRDIRYSLRRAQKMGALSFEVATRSNVGRLLDIFFSLHAARWSRRGETGVLANPVVQEFHREVAAGFVASGSLQLCILRFNGEPVAAVYAFSHRNCLYIYLTGFDPRFAKFSFGTLAISAAIEFAIKEGCREVDFLRGREPYKFRFGGSENQLHSLRCPAAAFEKFGKILQQR